MWIMVSRNQEFDSFHPHIAPTLLAEVEVNISIWL